MHIKRKPLVGEEKEITKKVGQRIAAARRSKGITQVELAKRANMTQAIISSYEQGRRRIPITQFLKIADAIGIPPAKLFDKWKTSNDERNNDRLLSRRFLKRLKQVENLPEAQQRTLAKTIDAFLAVQQMTTEKREVA